MPDLKSDAKMELIFLTSELMPKGAPNLLEVIRYPTIERLGQEMGKKPVLLMIFALVRDLCDSLNVVRNMSEDQMIESASMLLDECDNFRLEDYVMMFSMAKRGALVKIFDRIDMDLIGEIMDEYWKIRNEAGRRKQDENYREFEENLRKIERAPGKYLLPGETLDDTLMDQIKELTKKMTADADGENGLDFTRRDERIRRKQEMIWGSLTAEQQEMIRREKEKYVPSMDKKNDSSEKPIDSSEQSTKNSEKQH